jgi:glycosyltransferase involved in cell wall biosynthesis
MNGSRPTVSVVIPCYGYGRFLHDCVASVLGQEGVDVRVLIIDDASPDDSADVAIRLAADEERVEVRRHEHNRGHIATYNEGLLDWADGDYAILLSADDLLTPGAVARATAVLEAHPNVGFVYGHPLRFDDAEPIPVARNFQTGVNVWPGLEWFRIMCRLGHPVVSSPEVVVRTSVQKQIGGYDAALTHTGDHEMWMRFAVHSDVAFVKGVDQAYYRTHGENMTNQRVPRIDLAQRKAAYDAIFEAHGDKIPESGGLRRLAHRTIAKEALWSACHAYHRGAVDADLVADLLQFARDTYPETARLPEYWGLRWRQRVGPEVCAALRPVMVPAAYRGLRSRLWWRHWRREGV